MRKIVSFALVLVMLCVLFVPVAGASDADLQKLVNETAKLMLSVVPEPIPANIGGDWAVLGLVRSGYAVPEGYYESYYSNVVEYVKEKQGILHNKKYTDYSRLVLVLTAIGMDPGNVGGYSLLTPLGDYERVIWQGLNGPIWALLALDSGNYAVPVCAEAETQATRQMYIDRILEYELNGGGWTLSRRSADEEADPDITGMALQALSKYQDQKPVKAAIDRALTCMSKMQDEDGGFSTMGAKNCESAVQILVALCELGVSWNDPRFVKNGKSILDNVLSYRTAEGGFLHTQDGSGNNQMTLEQAFYGLVDAYRVEQGKSSLYRITSGRAPGMGLEGRNQDVQPKAVTKPGIAFADTKNSPYREAIEALASREIINGMGDGSFAPDKTMTRAEYATIVVKALGLNPKANGKFTDVAASAWYAGYIGTANSNGIVNGRSDTEFDPSGTITRQEAAVMTVRAAKLCGLDTGMSEAQIARAMWGYTDSGKAAAWAKEALAWCYGQGLLTAAETEINPTEDILRGEVADMLYRMLTLANLI